MFMNLTFEITIIVTRRCAFFEIKLKLPVTISPFYNEIVSIIFEVCDVVFFVTGLKNQRLQVNV